HKTDEKEQIVSYDASVMDWAWKGSTAMTEKESTIANPRYKPEKPGERLPFLIEPTTGKVAWPHLKPHFGKRVMFSHDHNPAPWLEMIRKRDDGSESIDPARPGENGIWSLCPENAGRKYYNIHFIKVPIEISKAHGKEEAIVDKTGLIYVLHEEEEAVRKNNDLRYPLVFRASVRSEEHTSELQSPDNPVCRR